MAKGTPASEDAHTYQFLVMVKGKNAAPSIVAGRSEGSASCSFYILGGSLGQHSSWENVFTSRVNRDTAAFLTPMAWITQKTKEMIKGRVLSSN